MLILKNQRLLPNFLDHQTRDLHRRPDIDVNIHFILRTLLLATHGVDYFFFFSSRRRHTRSLCDWSSDVCSSDLREIRHRQSCPRGSHQRHPGISDRKSTRLNSSHTVISYAVFCLKKKKKKK